MILKRLVGSARLDRPGQFATEGPVDRLQTAASLPDDELSHIILDVGLRRSEPDLWLFLNAIPRLSDRPVALDAAIEVVLSSLQKQGLTPERARDHLIESHPHLEPQINTAFALGEAMRGPGTLAAQLAPGAALVLPCSIGPVLASGRPRYDLHQLIGEGSQGAVFLAADRALSDDLHPAWVAVKRLHLGLAEGDALAAEAVRARRVSHENVVRALDCFTEPGGAASIVFEFVRGGSLDSWRRGHAGPIPPRIAARLIVQIARGVQAAHTAGLVHRDLKPGNILMSESGVPKVTDFGVAAACAGPTASHRQGSLGFIAPEQFRRDIGSVTAAADVYGLGGLLLWLLTDRCPNGDIAADAATMLSAPTRPAIAERIAAVRRLDADLRNICERALADDPRARYASADAMAHDLESWLTHRPLAWTRTPPVRRAGLAIRRSPVFVLCAVVGAAALVVATYAVAKGRADRAEAALAVALRDAHERETLSARVQGVDSIMKFLMSRASPDNAAASWTNMVTFLETVMGPAVLPPGGESAALWTRRIERVTAMVEVARSEGREGQLEPMMWESSLCVWLLRAGRAEEALPRLASLRERWRAILPAGDPWLTELEAMEACAQAMIPGPERSEALRRAAALAESLPAPSKPLEFLLERARE